MIEAIAAVAFFWLFAIWKTTDWINMAHKAIFLLLGLAMAFDALTEFGYIIKV